MKNVTTTSKALLLVSTLLSVVFISCVDPKEKITGYIVAKVFTPEHMSNESSKCVMYAIVVPHTLFHSTPPKPHKVENSWSFFIANKDMVLEKKVSKSFFDSRKCGEKITMYRY
jgi:hypothetical protein